MILDTDRVSFVIHSQNDLFLGTSLGRKDGVIILDVDVTPCKSSVSILRVYRCMRHKENYLKVFV